MSEETTHLNTANVVTEQDKGRCAPAPGSASAALKILDDFCHLPEGEWAAQLSNAELADELIANLWADISARERKKAAVLEAAIDRLRALPNTERTDRRGSVA